MGNPTERALKRKPQAIVHLAWEKDSTSSTPGDRDHEWFETDEGRIEFYDYCVEWNTKDVADNEGDIWYLIAEVNDTKASPMVLGRVSSQPDNEFMAERVAEIVKDPSLLVSPTAVKPPSGPKVTKAKGKTGAAAKAGVQPAEEGSVPTPKTVRRPQKAEGAASGPKGVAVPKAATLKKRLEEKKAENAASKTDPEFVVTVPSVAPATV